MKRLLFFFRDGHDNLIYLDNRFFPLAILLGRLINEKYPKKKLKFVNIFFSTDSTYALHPNAIKNYSHHYDGFVSYYDVFDIDAFNHLSNDAQRVFIWNRACEIIVGVSKVMANKELATACQYAHEKGLAMKLVADYQMIRESVSIFKEVYEASVWVQFFEDGMRSVFVLEKSGKVAYERVIDETKPGVEFFLEMYKKIEVKNDIIIIKGHRDVEYLPMTVKLDL